MKILQVLPVQCLAGSSLGGAEVQVMRLARGLLAKGVGSEILLLATEVGGDLRAELDGFAKAGGVVHESRWTRVQDPGSLWRLRRALRSLRVDVVHAHLMPAELSVSWLAGGPCAVTLHNDDPERVRPLRKILQSTSLAHYHGIICISQHIRRWIEQQGLVASGRARVIEYGLDEPVYLERAQARQELGVGDGVPLIATLSRLMPQKDLPTLLQAFQAVRRAMPEAQLLIFGKGPDENALKRLAEQMGLKAAVRFKGHVPGANRFMRGFDLFALSSLWEGLGLVLVEALLAPCPIVATRAGAIPDILGPSHNAHLATPGDAGELAQKMLARLRQGPDMVALEALRQAARERFALQRYVDEHLGFYRQLLSKK